MFQRLIKVYIVNQTKRYTKIMNDKSNFVAVCQMTSTNDKASNFKVVSSLVHSAKNQNAQMVFLPEGCDFIATNKNDSYELAEELTGPLVQQYQELAKSLNIWISIGGFHERAKELRSDKKIYNTHLIIDGEGKLRTYYRKLHLFDVDIPEKNLKLEESKYVNPGSFIVDPISTPVGNVGMAICYDLRFPEISIILRKLGATILTYPSAFTNATGILHWEILLRARAIENQCYVLAPAQIGAHNDKRTSHGRAMIIDPVGNIIAECEKFLGQTAEPSVIVAKIKSLPLTTVRSEMPIYDHRRNDVYLLNCLHHRSETIDYYFSNKIIPVDTVFYETVHSFAFTNIRCVVPGHVLIATKRVVQRLVDLNENEISDLFNAVIKVQKVVEQVYNNSSSTVVVQDGKDAGQTVKHVHVHILPRKEGDFVRNDEIYDVLATHDTIESKIEHRELTEMIEEAQKLKKLLV